MGIGGQCQALAALLPGRRPRIHCGPRGPSGWVRKISPPSVFDPRTHPVASHCTNYPIPAPRCEIIPLHILTFGENARVSSEWYLRWLTSSRQRVCSVFRVLAHTLWSDVFPWTQVIPQMLAFPFFSAAQHKMIAVASSDPTSVSITRFMSRQLSAGPVIA